MYIDVDQIKVLSRKFLQQMNHTGHFELDVSIVGPTKMRSLNRQYRQIDAPTDVLSFPISDLSPSLVSGHLSQVNSHQFPVILGSIVICPKIVAHRAKHGRYSIDHRSGQTDLNRYIMYVLVHGLMHLIGFDHGTDASEAQFNHKISTFFSE